MAINPSFPCLRLALLLATNQLALSTKISKAPHLTATTAVDALTIGHLQNQEIRIHAKDG